MKLDGFVGIKARMQSVEDYLRHAAECRTMAAKDPNPEHKPPLEQMAAAWDRLAESRKRALTQRHQNAAGEHG
jgi:hypothetical protein